MDAACSGARPTHTSISPRPSPRPCRRPSSALCCCRALFDLAVAGEPEGGFRAFGTALTSAILNAEAAFKRNGKTVGVATGFVDLDRKLGGLHRSDLIVLAGRPSMGKTSLATNIAFWAA